MRHSGLAVAAAALAACATVSSPPEPVSLEHGLLLARAEIRGSFFRSKKKIADTGAIIAVDANGVPIPGLRASSAFAANGYVIFFGMPAGRYLLRSATFTARGARYQVLAPQLEEAKRAVILRPGSAAYLGDHGFDSRSPELGTALLRAARIIAHWATPFLKRPLIPRDSDMRGFSSSPAEEIRALHAVRGSLARTQWRAVVDARLRELSAAEPAKIAGAVRPRELTLREEPFLSWRDTLRWGDPRRAPAGLAWRRGETQIAIFFTTATAPGFAGWDAAVSDLRRSASASVEDEGGVFEVSVATRTGTAARTTKYQYPEGVLVGSETSVIVTETTLVPDGYGMYTARLRAPRGEFEEALPVYREFLRQLVLGKPKPKEVKKQDVDLPFLPSPQ